MHESETLQIDDAPAGRDPSRDDSVSSRANRANLPEDTWMVTLATQYSLQWVDIFSGYNQ